MESAQVEELIRRIATQVEGDGGTWEFQFNNVRMAALVRPRYDRVRVVATITSTHSLAETELRRLLDANFHTTLDARYATSDGVLYALFTHALDALSRHQLRSAMQQVSELVRSHGTTYSSGDLHYGRPHEALT